MRKRASLIICLNRVDMEVKNFLYMLSGYEKLEDYQIIFAFDWEDEKYFRGLIKQYFSDQDMCCCKTRNIQHKAKVYNNVSEKAHSDVFIFMDTNIILSSGCLEELVKTLEEQDALAVQPLMIRYDIGTVYSTGFMYTCHMRGHALQNRGLREDIVCLSAPRTALTSSMLAINRLAYEELRGFSEDIPNEYIGQELTERITDLGYQNYYNHRARVYYVENYMEKVCLSWIERFGEYKSERILEEQLKNVCKNNRYAVLNFSQAFYTNEWLYQLGFRIIMNRNYNHFCMHEKIMFETVLPWNMVEQENDYLYIVNNFQQIKNNKMWFLKRRNHKDLIVDLSGNVIFCSDFLEEFKCELHTM